MSFVPATEPLPPPQKPVNLDSSAGNINKFLRRNILASVARPRYGNRRCERCRTLDQICWADPSYQKCWGCMDREKKNCGVHDIVFDADTPMSGVNDDPGDDDDNDNNEVRVVSEDELEIREQYEAMRDFDFGRPQDRGGPVFGPSAEMVNRLGERAYGRTLPLMDDPASEGGFVHGEPVDDGSVHGGPVDDESVHGGPVRGGSVHGGPVDDGSVHGGPVRGGSVHGGPVNDGSVHGGPVHGGSVNQEGNSRLPTPESNDGNGDRGDGGPNQAVARPAEPNPDNCADWLADRRRVEEDLRLEQHRFAQRRRRAEAMAPGAERDQALQEVEEYFAYLQKKRIWIEQQLSN